MSCRSVTVTSDNLAYFSDNSMADSTAVRPSAGESWNRLAVASVASAAWGSALAGPCGVVHPALVPPDAIELLDVDLKTVPVDELLGYRPGWGLPGPADVDAITRLMAPTG